MNEIRFRLIKDGQIVGYERNILVDGEIEIHHKLPGKHSWHDIRFEPARFIHHDAKEQFTGLLDKNGKDVYKADRCRFPSGAIREIIFQDGAFGYLYADDFHAFGGHIHLKEILAALEVIGTIHDTGK